MSQIDLKGAPFSLDEEGIRWVENTKRVMSIEGKIGQLLFLIGMSTKESELETVVNSVHPGGMMYRTATAAKVAAAHRVVQRNSAVPMFLAANLEAGGSGLIEEGTTYGHQLLVAASDDEECAYRLGLVCGREAATVGGNMAFAPIIDINRNFRNPITNIRSFGDDPERVARMGAAYVRGAQDAGLCVTIKHFPGDGMDGRDQHLVTTYNSLPFDEWMATFGNAYRVSIEAGARGLMAGHIGLPSYIDRVRPGDEVARRLPATLNSDLIEGLLRGELGYNGVILTDASLMAGFGQHGKRRDLVPASIAAGCDMFLFTRQPEEDYAFMLDGHRNGIITDERLDDAITRILALKASLGLHKKTLRELVPDTFETLDRTEHVRWSEELADKGVTLVRDDQGLLPLDPAVHKKIGVIFNGNEGGMDKLFKNIPGFKGAAIRTMMAVSKLGKGKQLKDHQKFIAKLRDRGFDAFEYNFGNILEVMGDMQKPLQTWVDKFDVVIYLAKWETMSNQTSLQFNYKAMGFDAPWFVDEIPTVLVSVANPYHGYDVPMIRTVINGYSPTEPVYEAIVDKMMGRSEFRGVSPVKLDYTEIDSLVDPGSPA